jgi:regulator of sigma E protease
MDLIANGTNILLIVLGFGLLIFVHELGHFLAARWAGIRVDAFAVGMGPQVLAWRGGVGLRIGSTDPAVHERTGKSTIELSDAELAAAGIGETEYSLRLLPLGGFVKMLGQDDLDPNASSDSIRSYNRCGIGRRMVVVSAGVFANIVLAVALFLVAFLAGVRFEAPMVGEVIPGSPAALADAVDDGAGPATSSGLRPGDVVLAIDGERVDTFADIQIAAAMARPGRSLRFDVERDGRRLTFPIEPQLDETSGLLSVGIVPAAGTTLAADDEIRPMVDRVLAETGLLEAGVAAGMRVVEIDGTPAKTFDQVQSAVAASDGRAIPTRWIGEDDVAATAMLPVEPTYERLVYPTRMPAGAGDFEFGLLGLVPLVRIEQVLETSENVGRLQSGDVVLRIGSLDGPRMAEFRAEVTSKPGETVRMLLLRDGGAVEIEAEIDRRGRLGVGVGYARNLPLVARPFDRLGRPAADGIEPVRSPAAELGLLPRTRLVAVGETPIGDWAEFRAALRAATEDAHRESRGAEVELSTTPPTPDAPTLTTTWTLSADEVADLHALGWTTPLPAVFFDPVFTVLSADGSPIRAVGMGFEQTWKMVTLTYLTIDRLVRGTVGVEQLHGPVGIVHLGTRVADRGLMYLVFFLAMISVNLAVLNFLPLPIVDGGLFLFLLYEKFRGRPPSPAFQSGATLVGLVLIGSLFVVTFYNDLMRLFG